MEYEDIYQPLVDFITENYYQLIFLQGEVDNDTNEVMFYLPEVVRGDKSTQKLYVEFSLPNTFMDKIIENQKKLQDMCAALKEQI